MSDAPDLTTPNGRIRAARERAGLELGDMAGHLDMSFESYRDLEDFDDDVNGLHLKTVHKLARVLGLSVRYILEGDGPNRPFPSMSFTDFSSAVAESVRASGGNADAWGERVGWDVEPLLRDPEEIWNCCPEGLREIAEAVGIDYRAVLPD